VRRPLRVRRGLSGALALGSAALLTIGALAAGSSAQAAVQHSSQASSGACAHAGGSTRVGHFVGILHPRVASGCGTHTAGDPANGTPPLLYHGGPVMGTAKTGPVVIRPIFWEPSGHPINAAYQSIISSYLQNVAADSGKHTNVFSTLTEYYGSNGAIQYKVAFRAPIIDHRPLPANGCTVAATDKTKIYADNSGYNACLDDDQVIAETEAMVTGHGLPSNYGHLYVMFLPKHVESCFYPGATDTASNFCTVNHQPSAAYCAYHSFVPASGTVYANMPYPIYSSDTGYTCSSDASFPVVEAPNGSKDADTEISPTSHEIMEAITDPDTTTGWYDSNGFENGDECAYVYGAAMGYPGRLFNQVINGKHYLTQEEFSNRDFAATGGGCVQSE
jgi:hypothetical protein